MDAIGEHTLGDGPIPEDLRPKMEALANLLDHALNLNLRNGAERQMAFVLIAAPFGPAHGLCSYISNADRDSVTKLLKDQLKFFEAQGNG